MPVAKRGERGGTPIAILTFAATAGVVAIIFLFSRNADLIGGSSTGSGLLGAGATFQAPAEPLADTIADSGPTILPDVASRDRDIILQHLGDDDTTGWYAFSARELDASRECVLEWEVNSELPDGGDFVDSCDGARFPADGAGLQQFPVTVDGEGVLTIDLNAAERDADTSEDSDNSRDAESSESSDGE